jgi:hypothetical protein
MKNPAGNVGISDALRRRGFGSYRSMYSLLQYSGTDAIASHQRRDQDVSQAPERGPLIQFARFVDGEVVLFHAYTKNLEYVAVSHVWGRAEWQHITGVQGDILVSEDKATFISENLPQLLDGLAFWMDVVCINQRKRAEVTATVQFIPNIFRDAARTMVVRECDGLYNCCTKLVEGFCDRHDLQTRLVDHARDHRKPKLDESYLQRLWTLQECLLSHTLQFVFCGPCEYHGYVPDRS